MNNQLNLQEPEKMDWDNFNPGSSYQRPPKPINGDGKRRVFYGKLPSKVEYDATKQYTDDKTGAVMGPFRKYTFVEPIVLMRNNDPTVDGYQIRFTSVNVMKWGGREVSGVGLLLKAAGLTAKPQTNSEYDAAVAMIVKQQPVVSFTADWVAHNTDTNEWVKGYNNFPDDPERPGEKKAILEKGDTYMATDIRGKELGLRQVKADALFANLFIKAFAPPNK